MSNFYTSAPICTPARASLLTGRYPARVGVEKNLGLRDRSTGLSPTVPSLAKLLSQNGYATGICGKWHLGVAPEFGPKANGFGEFFGIIDWSVDYFSHRNPDGRPALYENETLVERDGYLTDLITDCAVSFIEGHESERFFLYVPYNAAVLPIQPPGNPHDIRSEQTWFKGTRADYGRMVEALDGGVGRILAALEGRGLTQDVLVIYTNDHGGEWLARNEPFFHGFGTLWEGGIRVPCFIRWPRRWPAGKVSDQIAIMMDLTVTILAAAGVEPPAMLDGENLLPTAEGKQPPLQRTLFWRLDHSGRQQKAVRRGQWKYLVDIWNEMLFDLEADRGERRNLLYAYPDVAVELRRALDAWEASLSQGEAN
jgi:arylsulfatase A-like enzyme